MSRTANTANIPITELFEWLCNTNCRYPRMSTLIPHTWALQKQRFILSLLMWLVNFVPLFAFRPGVRIPVQNLVARPPKPPYENRVDGFSGCLSSYTLGH